MIILAVLGAIAAAIIVSACGVAIIKISDDAMTEDSEN